MSSVVCFFVGGEGLHARSAAYVASMARPTASPAGYSRENTGELIVPCFVGVFFYTDNAEKRFIAKKGYSLCTLPTCLREKALGESCVSITSS